RDERFEPTRRHLGVVVQRNEKLSTRARTSSVQRRREAQLDRRRLYLRSLDTRPQPLRLLLTGAVQEDDRLEGHRSGGDRGKSLQAALEQGTARARGDHHRRPRARGSREGYDALLVRHQHKLVSRRRGTGKLAAE